MLEVALDTNQRWQSVGESKKWYRAGVIAAAIVVDFVATALAYLTYYQVRFSWGLLDDPLERPPEIVLPLLLLSVIWVVIFAVGSLYRSTLLFNPKQSLRRGFWLTLVGLMAIFFLFFFEANQAGKARLTIFVYGFGVYGYLALARLGLWAAHRALLRRGIGQTRLLTITTEEHAHWLLEQLIAGEMEAFQPVAMIELIEDEDDASTYMEVVVIAPSGEAISSQRQPVSKKHFKNAVMEALEKYDVENILVVLPPDKVDFYLGAVSVASTKRLPIKFVRGVTPIVGTLASSSYIPELKPPGD